MTTKGRIRRAWIRRLTVAFAVTVLFVMMLTAAAMAQNHSYPRAAIMHFGKASADWYARYDMVIFGRNDVNEVRKIKAINPQCLVLSTHRWTQWGRNFSLDPFPKEWFAKDSQGNELAPEFGNKLINITNFCTKVNGQRYNEYMPQYLVNLVDLNVFDGLASDWAWGKPHNIDDIDLDQNGRNDYDEHGKEWVERVWLEGLMALITKLRNLVGPDKIIWVNSGLFQEWGWNETNGLMLEHLPGFYGWNYFWRMYQDWMAQARRPHVLFVDVEPTGSDTNAREDTKNNLRFMRFMLTATLLGDGYFGFQPQEAGEHHYYAYYDEFDVDLGFPTSEVQKLANGCYARIFDRGAVIVNPTGSSQTVSNADLASLAGYDGPYFRFKGGQDPLFNNGQIFDQINLWGYERSSGKLITLGDGIVLVKHPRAVVSDIIVDNLGYVTSPTHEPAILQGTWTQTEDGDNQYVSISRGEYGWFPHAFASRGNGEATATFRPTIGVSGKYEVFEWHGYVTRDQMATNVPYTITADGVEVRRSIDQNANQGRWNSLGVFNFSKGNTGKVTISNAANGLVAVDAIKFVYREDAGLTDTQAPALPTGVKVTNPVSN